MLRDKKTIRRSALLGLAAAALFTISCEVTNPGPVQDAFLNAADAWPGVVKGAARVLSNALDERAYSSAAISREIHPSGSTGSYGITVRQQAGELAWDEEGWADAQSARWVAEDGIRRMTGQPPYDNPPPETTPDPDLLAELYLWAGYANRLLGELWCDAVIDGGAPEPYTVFLDRAVDHFTNAISNATAGSDLQLAAYAGRASVYVDLGQWPAAVADAGQVTDPGFSWVMEYDADFGTETWNTVYWATAGQSYRAHTMWNTPYAQAGDAESWSSTEGSYYAFEPNDPRVPYLFQDEEGDAAIECCGHVPWWPETKYDDRGDDIELSSYEEMRLIEAENLLRGGAGNIATAIGILNALRTDVGLTTQWDPTVSLDSAWAILKRERGIELFLEGRRLPDLRRWARDNTPGALDPLEHVTSSTAPYHPSHLRVQDLCYPIPEAEEQTNHNVCADENGNIIPCG